MKRRSFMKTVGQAAAAASLPQLWSACRPAEELRPNILWIYVEDLSPLMSCYGYDNPTPHLDRLAGEGVLFKSAYMPAPVCSACRSALITGVMQTTLGIHHHHSSRSLESAILLPEEIKTLPELFRQAGYFTFNQGKDDYNFWYDRESLYAGGYTTHALYGKSGDRDTGWNDRPPGQPFFGQLQLSGGKHIYREDFKENIRNPVDRRALDLPPYYPDHPLVREDWARHMESARITDEEVGEIVERLRLDGLLENTVVFFFSDHGMRLWRHKQFCYDGGLHVPFVMCWPGNARRLGGEGRIREDLVSGLDIAATSLALAGIEIPAYMEGRDLFARGIAPREYVISARDRCDYTIDRIRTVRTERFRYIRNFMTDRPYMQPNYRDAWEITRVMRELHAEGRLDEIQDRFWSEERPEEELYAHADDPHETVNLAGRSEYADELERHRRILDRWIRETGDKGQYPEDDPNLKYMFDWWGDKCVNPEYDRFRK